MQGSDLEALRPKTTDWKSSGPSRLQNVCNRNLNRAVCIELEGPIVLSVQIPN